jgi:IS5 family transposase
VLRETDPQATLWELLLPEQAKRLPAELARVDAYLDDERFIAPWRGLFSARLGRPSVPVEVLLRLLYLKHRYGLGYETLCREVGDSISWRRFCRIPLDRPVPHPTTLARAGGSRRPRGGRGAERRAAGKARRRQAAARPQAAGGHHRGGGRHRLPDRRRPARARGPQARRAGPAHQGPWCGQQDSLCATGAGRPGGG